MTETILAGRRQGFRIVPDNSITWGDLTNAPYQTWSNWNSWKITTGVQVSLQFDDDLGSIDYRIPEIDVLDLGGDATIVLKISDTGTFTGEETTLNLTLDTSTAYVSGRYYRWTITVDANSEHPVPYIGNYIQKYKSDYSIETLEDVDVLGSTTTTLSTNLGLVRNIQATALRGDPYVLDGYIQTAEENISRYPTTVDNVGPTGVTLTSSADSRNFVSGTSVLDFDNSDTVGGGLNVLRISDATSLQEAIENPLTGTNDWTIEFLVYNPQDVLGAKYLIAQQDIEANHAGATESWVFFITTSLSAEQLVFRSGQPGSQYTLNYSGPPGSSNFVTGWNHCAVVREGSTVSLYLNGSREDTDTYSETDVQSAPVIIGGNDTDSDGLPDTTDTDTLMTGIRISNTARYSGASYTVPTALFSNDEYTNLLIQNSLTDDSGYEDNGIEYIIEQQGGSPVILQKNPPQVQVVDYNGNAWDGTIDAVLRGLPKIVYDGFSVRRVNT